MLRLPATAKQLAWYIERDGARYENFQADGGRDVRVPLGAGGHVLYRVPADMVPAIEAERDVASRKLAERRRDPHD